MSDIEQAAQEDTQQITEEDVATSVAEESVATIVADEAVADEAVADEAVAPVADADEPAKEVRLRSLDVVVEELRGSGRTPEQALEALLFSTHTPLNKDEIGQALGMDLFAVEASVMRLKRALEQRGAPLGVFIRSKDDGSGKKLVGQEGYILDVRASYRQTMVTVGRPVLSQSLTETLALIALNQPIGQSRLVRERGSTVYEHVKDLQRRGWIVRVKKGRSYELRTTETFAAEFGLEDDVNLIKRALARTAGVHGEAELVGSSRVHFEVGAEGEIDLAAEARDCLVSGGEAPIPLPRFAVGAECLISGGGVDETADAEPAERAEPKAPSALLDLVAEMAAENLSSNAFARPVIDALSEIEGAEQTSIPTAKADCILDLGVAKTPLETPTTPKEAPMADTVPTPGQDGDQPDLSKTETNKRLAGLFEAIDDESTDDDW
jgi:segregation and condensation protein B